jgi:DNA-directed RNA polymerase omega subunit
MLLIVIKMSKMGNVIDKPVSVEKCLEKIPNKFRLAVFTMGRARDLLLGAKTTIENTKYTKRSINKTLQEIEDNKLNLVELENKIKNDLLTNNLFLKNIHTASDDEITGGEDTTMEAAPLESNPETNFDENDDTDLENIVESNEDFSDDMLDEEVEDLK